MSLQGLLGQYSPRTQILTPVSSARSWMASSKHSASAKTGGTLRNKSLRLGTEGWKNMSFYTRKHWRRCQRDMLSMGTESTSESLLGKALASRPSLSNNSLMDTSPASQTEKGSKTCPTLLNSTPLVTLPRGPSSPCLAG